jgi:excisionase family DNA binding protein
MHDEGIGSAIEQTADGDGDSHPEPRLTDDRLTWTVPEAARLLGISKDSAYEAARRGDLPVRVIGRRTLIPRAALLRLLDEAHAPDRQHPPPGPSVQAV